MCKEFPPARPGPPRRWQAASAKAGRAGREIAVHFAQLGRTRAPAAKRLARVLAAAYECGVSFATFTRPHFICLLVGAFLAFAPLLHAGVVTDGTVGAAGAIGKVGGDFAIPQTLGTKVGGNLFHSFSQFDLSAGESATFSGTNDVGNILARVTGGSASSIDGTIRSTISNANLFLINPSGVLFGPNAKLEVDGSFAATTADYGKLNGGGRFDAKTPADDVLTGAPVSAFGFLSPKPAAISAARRPLAVKAGAKLAFLGGDPSVKGSNVLRP